MHSIGFLANKSISFMKMLKSMGSSIEPWGAPGVIFLYILKRFPTLNFCFLFVRLFFINSKDKISNPYASILAIEREWSKKSKA